MHDLGLDLYRHDWEDPFVEGTIGEKESVRGLKGWFEDFEKMQKNDFWRFRQTLETLTNQKILTKESTDKSKLNREKLITFIQKKLRFEIQYCQQISIDKTQKTLEHLPDYFTLSKEVQRYLKGDSDDYEVIERTDREPDEDEIDYEKRLAGFIGDEIEKRLRKVLSEFFEKN